jgi:Uma2 family endonuclease
MATRAPRIDPTRRWTARQVQALPADGNRYEVVRGELLVTAAPSSRHQAIITSLLVRLGDYLARHGLERTLFAGPADISWDDETLVQPDILVVAPDEVSERWATFRTLRLAVEVLSPSSHRHDRVVKRRLYQEQGVATYWIVDPLGRLVEVWRPGDERPQIVTDTLVWRAQDDLPAVEIEVEALTAPLAEA